MCVSVFYKVFNIKDHHYSKIYTFTFLGIKYLILYIKGNIIYN